MWILLIVLQFHLALQVPAGVAHECWCKELGLTGWLLCSVVRLFIEPCNNPLLRRHYRRFALPPAVSAEAPLKGS